MRLSQEIDKVFAKLKHDLIDPDVAAKAVEQLISAHARKPPAQLDASIRSAVDRMRHRAADYIAIEAEVAAWICLRGRMEEADVLWL
jgi:hypothetical protein